MEHEDPEVPAAAPARLMKEWRSTIPMKEIYVVNCCRTAVGSFGGSLKDTPAPELGAVVVKEALSRAGVEPEQVDELMFAASSLLPRARTPPARWASRPAALLRPRLHRGHGVRLGA